ncbi:ATP-dependent helicase [Blattabacterium cuenoti]|uniref:ATP-dependent helicase n=1 Tax=Blattabacterium cuenoti TaxID=1653831 RepID=UPI00163C19F9|nr:UvrD-helicase domain-containing protein [Blattabacterium cuenoti]
MNKDLNHIQKKIIETIYGPILVIAGAGSGKTRVITYRIAYMIKKIGINPSNILAITFTNKAAREMKNRISIMINKTELSKITIGTFHSIFSRILRAESHYIGYKSNYTIYDQKDSENVIKQILKDISFDKNFHPKEIKNRISEYKNNLYCIKNKNNFFYKIYKLYAKRCYNAGALDFDDILLHTNRLFYYYPDILIKYQNKFKYILIDEYQDTNISQNCIIKNLYYKYKNIFAVGDDAQSIYSFRGANISNILNFHVHYKKAKIFRLEQNYRSTDSIVQASNYVIACNKNQIYKKIWTNNEKGEKIKIYCASSETDEAQYIASSILSIKKQKELQYNSFAILYRANFQSKIIEFTLKKMKIPYKIYGNISLENRKEIRDFLSYLRIIINHYDEPSLLRILKKKIEYKKTFDSILNFSKEKKIRIYDIVKNINYYKIFFKIKKTTIDKLNNFFFEIDNIKKNLNKKNIKEDIKNIIYFFLKENPTEKINDLQYIIDNISFYIDEKKQFGNNENPSLSEFIQNFYLEEHENDKDINKNNIHEKNKVSLMTIHLSKGLEFPVVFITGLEENLFPSKSSYNNPLKIEEERRLFYVALTRAKKIAMLSYSKYRFLWGEKKKNTHSRFINEMNKVLIKIENKEKKLKSLSFNFKKYSFEKKKITCEKKIEKGMKVFHPNFGIGIIINFGFYKTNEIVTVLFKKFGEKRILLKLNKLILI